MDALADLLVAPYFDSNGRTVDITTNPSGSAFGYDVGSYTGIIMIVDTIGENAIFAYRQYQEVDESLSHAEKIEYTIAAYLRPNLMTAFVSIMALLPLALGICAVAKLHQPLVIAVIGDKAFALPLCCGTPTILKLIKP